MKLLLVIISCAYALFGLDINSATIEEFESLNGVGKNKAEKIVAYRDSIKCFKSVDELKNVNGIGESILVKNKDILEIGECKK